MTFSSQEAPIGASPADPARRSQRVLVTGGAGFIGSHLIRSYLARGATVRMVVRARDGSHGAEAAQERGVERIELDLCDDAGVRGSFAGQDLVIHAAAVTRAGDPEQLRLQAWSNVQMTRVVLEACRAAGVRRLLHVSSTAAVGISPDPNSPADETFAYNLAALGVGYSRSKHESERLVLEANGPTLETVVVNPGVVFGRHATRYVGGDIIARVLRRRIVPCTGGGLSVVHVQDVVDGIHRAAERGRAGERYILSGENLSFLEIAHVVCRVAKVQRRILRIPDVVRDTLGAISTSLARVRRGSPNTALVDRYAYRYYTSEKARRELGYEPRRFESIVRDYLEAMVPAR
jgi:dihydroflavonol-4-reductase